MRRKFMKKWLCKGTLVATVTAFALLGASRAQAGTCSNGSLRGNYGSTITGQLGQAPGPLIPLEGLALSHFDGKGHLKQVDFTVINGVPSGSDFSEEGDETGTYTVNPDCTGTATINFPDGRQLDLKLVVVKGGSEVYVVVSALTAPDGTPLFVTTRSHGVRVDQAD
jgi:hypothetical protein